MLNASCAAEDSCCGETTDTRHEQRIHAIDVNPPPHPRSPLLLLLLPLSADWDEWVEADRIRKLDDASLKLKAELQ